MAHHFAPTTEFNTRLMDKYSFFTSYCIHADGVIDKLVERWEKAKKILEKSEFRILYVVDPPEDTVVCYISNYKSYKRSRG